MFCETSEEWLNVAGVRKLVKKEMHHVWLLHLIRL